MTKRILGLALAGAAAASFALPATPANAACNWTFPRECVEQILSSIAIADVCVPLGTFTYCVGPVST